MAGFASGNIRHKVPFSAPRIGRLRCRTSLDQTSPQREVNSSKAEGPVKQPAFKVRQAKQTDVDVVAALCAQVFGPTTFSGIASFLVPSSLQVQKASTELRRDVNIQLTKSLKAKQDARREAREFRLLQMNAMLRAEIDRLTGKPYVSRPSAPNALQRQALRRWRRCRQFVCLVAEPAGGDSAADIAGCAVVSLAAPEALLPPPWPSRAPLRCCISNVAVSDAFRRRGAARQLLAASECLARRWGHEELYLHTEVQNQAALRLYLSAGYQEQKKDPAFFGPFRRVLLRKALPPHSRKQPDSQLKSGAAKEDGTYVWNVSQE